MATYIKCDNDRFVNVDIVEAFECGWNGNRWVIYMYFNNHKDRYVISPFQSHKDAHDALVTLMYDCIDKDICKIDECEMFKDDDYSKEGD